MPTEDMQYCRTVLFCATLNREVDREFAKRNQEILREEAAWTATRGKLQKPVCRMVTDRHIFKE